MNQFTINFLLQGCQTYLRIYINMFFSTSFIYIYIYTGRVLGNFATSLSAAMGFLEVVQKKPVNIEMAVYPTPPLHPLRTLIFFTYIDWQELNKIMHLW